MYVVVLILCILHPAFTTDSINVISTIAGTGTAGYSNDGSAATKAKIQNPHGIVIDTSGNVYFNDHNNHRIRKITVSTGIISTYAGTGSTTFSDNVQATSATLYQPNGLCIDSSGIHKYA